MEFKNYIGSHVTVKPTHSGWTPVYHHVLTDGELSSIPGMIESGDRAFVVRQAQQWAKGLGVKCLAA